MKKSSQITYSRTIKFIFLNLLFAISAYADVSFTTTATTARVSTVTGFDEQIGAQEPPNSVGVIRNDVFAQVAEENDLGLGRGQASGSVSVETVNSRHLFVRMQSTASALAESGQASSESSVTFFFNNPGKVFVEVGIRQGNTSIFIDGVKRPISNEFPLLQGQHKFEIRAQSNGDLNGVINPNFAVALDIIEDELSDGQDPQNDDPATPLTPPNSPQGNVKGQITTIKQLVKSLKSPKNKIQKAAAKNVVTLIKSSETNLRNELALSNAAVSGKLSLSQLLGKVKSTTSALKNKSGDKLKTAKKNANKALTALEKALGL